MFLAPDELDLFRRIHTSVMAFANDGWAFAPGATALDDYIELGLQEKWEIREGFFAHREEIVDAYLRENPDALDDDLLAEVATWKHALSGEFFLFRQLKKHAIFLQVGGEETVAYGVVGLTQPCSDIVDQPPPAFVGACLLPFRGRIVTDGILVNGGVRFGPGGRRSLDEDYKAAKAGKGIVTSLATRVPTKKQTGRQRVAALVRSLRSRLDKAKDLRSRITRFEEETLPRVEGWIRERFRKEHEAIARLEEEVAELEREQIESLRSVLPEEFDEFDAAMDALFGGGREGAASAEEAPTSSRSEDGANDAGGADSGPPPSFVVDMMFEEYMEATHGERVARMSDEEYEEARQAFDEAVRHASEGNRAAFDKTMLGVGADRSDENRTAVNKAYRRVARSLHPDRNADFGEGAKELWDELGRARQALDLTWIERIEMKWRFLRGDRFLVKDEKRLRRFRDELDEEIAELSARAEECADHPMWGREGAEPGPEDEEEIAEELRSRQRELRERRESLRREVAGLRGERPAKKKRPTPKKRTKAKRKATRGKKKTTRAKKKAAAKTSSKKKAAAKKAPAKAKKKAAGKKKAAKKKTPKAKGETRREAAPKKKPASGPGRKAEGPPASGREQMEFDF